MLDSVPLESIGIPIFLISDDELPEETSPVTHMIIDDHVPSEKTVDVHYRLSCRSRAEVSDMEWFPDIERKYFHNRLLSIFWSRGDLSIEE